MDETQNQSNPIDQPRGDAGFNGEKGKDVVAEKVDWVAKAIEYEATPKSLRIPKSKGEFIESLGVPSSTYYDKISETETQRIIIDICFKQAKRRTPEILEKLGEKAELGDNTSIQQFMDYVLEKTKKTDITSGGKTIPIYGGISGHNSHTENILPEKEN